MPPLHQRPGHPPHHPHPRHGPGHRPIPASQLLGFVDEAALSQSLAGLLPDDGDRRFVVRCLVGEGPAHHRGANFVLLSLLQRLLERWGARPPDAAAGLPVPMRLPPHLAANVDPDSDDGHYPLRLPVRALDELADGDPGRRAAMVDCLTDGPPQHALANVLMVAMLDALLGEAGGAGTGHAP